MRTMIRWICRFCLLCFALNAADECALSALHEWKDGFPVRVRGFLYRAENSQVILAGEPNLKTCCVASPSKRNEQLVIESYEEEPPKHTVVVLEGSLHRDGEVFRLKNARRIENSGSWLWISASGIILGLIAFLIAKI